MTTLFGALEARKTSVSRETARKMEERLTPPAVIGGVHTVRMGVRVPKKKVDIFRHFLSFREKTGIKKDFPTKFDRGALE